MKNIIKIFSFFLVITTIVSCTEKEDVGYNAQEERGWVQFMDNSPSMLGAFQGAIGTLDMDVNLQVPTTSSDLTINYSLESVSGLNPNTVFSNNGNFIAPAGRTSYAGPANSTGLEYSYLGNISLDLSELSGVTLTEPMVFDVVLTGTSSPTITAGLAGETFKVAQRVVINPSISQFVGSYSVFENFTGGGNAPFGLNNFFGESYQIDLALDATDTTASKAVITNSAGFDWYFIDGVEVTFGLDGSLFFDDGNSTAGYPVVALFRIFEFETSSYDYGTGVLSAQGPLDTFGPYQFTLTPM